MRVNSPFLILWLQLAVRSQQAPMGTSGGQPIAEASPPLSTIPLHDLVDGYLAKLATAKDRLRFKNDFAGHPDFAKVDLDSEDRKKTIKALLEIKKQSVEHSLPGKKTQWAHKFTLATYHMMKDRNPQLLKDYQLYNHELAIKSNNARKAKRYQRAKDRNEEEFRQRCKENKARWKSRRQQQRREQSVMNRPLLLHLGRMKRGADRSTAAQVVEQAKQFGHLYSSPAGFSLAIRKYLRSLQFKEEDITDVLRPLGRETYLKSIRKRQAKLTKDLREAKNAMQGESAKSVHSPKSVQTDAAEGGHLAKENRISRLLASTDWYKSHHL